MRPESRSSKRDVVEPLRSLHGSKIIIPGISGLHHTETPWLLFLVRDDTSPGWYRNTNGLLSVVSILRTDVVSAFKVRYKRDARDLRKEVSVFPVWPAREP